jgi:hypothetical protein
MAMPSPIRASVRISGLSVTERERVSVRGHRWPRSGDGALIRLRRLFNACCRKARSAMPAGDGKWL